MVADLDGTLVTEQKVLTQRAQAAVQPSLHDLGHKLGKRVLEEASANFEFGLRGHFIRTKDVGNALNGLL